MPAVLSRWRCCGSIWLFIKNAAAISPSNLFLAKEDERWLWNIFATQCRMLREALRWLLLMKRPERASMLRQNALRMSCQPAWKTIRLTFCALNGHRRESICKAFAKGLISERSLRRLADL